MQRIALTGGPGAGKTTVGRELLRRHPQRFAWVPEAASQVYRRLNTRWDRLGTEGRRAVQRQIYALQIEQEDQAALAHPGRVLLCDRGTVDGAAYWPDGPEDYWRQLGTTWAAELARYDAVIWMQSCAAVGLYAGDGSNPCRHEDAAAAVERGASLAQVWQSHPRLHRVDAYPHLRQKIDAVEQVLRNLHTL